MLKILSETNSSKECLRLPGFVFNKFIRKNTDVKIFQTTMSILLISFVYFFFFEHVFIDKKMFCKTIYSPVISHLKFLTSIPELILSRKDKLQIFQIC